MEIDNLKYYRHVIKAPVESPGEVMKPSQIAPTGLIEVLKAEDAKQAALLKRARPFWLIAAALWIFSAVGLLLTHQASSQQIDPGFPLRASLAFLFSGLAVVLFFQVKRLSTIDYTEPVALFLLKAAQRYQFMSAPALLLAVLISAVLALVASVYIVDVFRRYFGLHEDFVGLAASFAFVAVVFLFGYFVSKKSWKRTKAPLLAQITKMQADLQNEAR